MEVCYDSIQLAGQIGRLDFISALLAIIGIALVLGGIFSFINFRSLAKQKAEEVAAQIAKEIAEREANLYIQRNLPGIIEAYEELADDQDEFDGDFNIDFSTEEGNS